MIHGKLFETKDNLNEKPDFPWIKNFSKRLDN